MHRQHLETLNADHIGQEEKMRSLGVLETINGNLN